MKKILALVAILMIFPACAGGKNLTRRPATDAQAKQAAADKQEPAKPVDPTLAAIMGELKQMKLDQAEATKAAEADRLELQNKLTETTKALEDERARLAATNEKLNGSIEEKSVLMPVPGEDVRMPRGSGDSPSILGSIYDISAVYIGGMPVGTERTAAIRTFTMKSFRDEVWKELIINGNTAMVVLPTAVPGQPTLLAFPNGSVQYEGHVNGVDFRGLVVTTTIQVRGANGAVINVPRETDGSYHVNTMVPGLGLYPRQMILVDDNTSNPNSVRLVDARKPGQKIQADLYQGARITTRSYMKHGRGTAAFQMLGGESGISEAWWTLVEI